MAKTVNPAIDEISAQSLLRDELSIDFENFQELGIGQISRTYSFNHDDRTYILQFTEQNMSQGCRNERLFRKKFQKMGIPVRSVVHEGDYAGVHYTVAKKMDGNGLDKLPYEEYIDTLPSVISTMLDIADVHIANATGYGWLDKNGNGKFPSWTDQLRYVRVEEPGQFYGHWHHLFDDSFLDRAVFDHYFEKMDSLTTAIPDSRELVHGSFGYGNLLAEDNLVTAVLDWQDALYGDHVFDLAYLLHWFDTDTRETIIDRYKREIEKRGRIEKNVAERILCYQYYNGVDGLRFAAKTDNKEFYDAVLEKLSSIDKLS